MAPLERFVIYLYDKTRDKTCNLSDINEARQYLFCQKTLDCFTLLLARHLADVSCYIGPSMPSEICMEIHTEIVQKGQKKQSRDKGIPRQPHVYL